MYRCAICRFEVPLDDVEAPNVAGHCICLRCYLRESGQEKPMPKTLRKDIEHALGEEPTSQSLYNQDSGMSV